MILGRGASVYCELGWWQVQWHQIAWIMQDNISANEPTSHVRQNDTTLSLSLSNKDAKKDNEEDEDLWINDRGNNEVTTRHSEG